jgi:hypothetical protein
VTAPRPSGPAVDLREPGAAAGPEGDPRLYVYAVVPAATALPSGHEFRGLRSVEVEDLAAVVGPLTPAMRSAGTVEIHEVIDELVLDQLAAAAAEHERMVEGLLAAAEAMVPLRFGTVAPDEEAVRTLVVEAGDDLRRDLDRARGRAEWGVRIFVDLAALGPDQPDGTVPTDGRPAHEGAPGRSFLEAKRRERVERAAAADRLAAAIEGIHEELAGSSVGAAVRSQPVVRVPRPEGGDGRVLVGCGAYLVARGGEDSFVDALESAVARLGGGCLEAEVTGPWPAYHFVGDPGRDVEGQRYGRSTAAAGVDWGEP